MGSFERSPDGALYLPDGCKQSNAYGTFDRADLARLLDFCQSLIAFQGDPKALSDCAVQGKNFVFSGTFCRSHRQNYEDAVRKLGGFIQETITRRTDYLVTGDHPAPSWNNSLYGKKIQRAQEYGRIPVLAEVFLAE